MYWYKEVCSHCTHSIWLEKYRYTVPSIYRCLNKESENYNAEQAWSETCDKYEERKE